MSFVFSAEKAAQAAAYFLRQYPGNALTRGKLIKLLYLSDRLSLERRGFPITGDAAYAMRDGPVLTEIYDLIKGTSAKTDSQEIWSHFIESERMNVLLKTDPGDGKLSKSDTDTLRTVYDKFGHMTFRELSALTHNLDEYKLCFREDTSTGIPLRTMLDAVGRKQDAERIERTREFDKHMASLFGC